MTHKMKVTDLSGLDSQLMPHASAELEGNICIADAVARLAKDTYDTLPQVGKPVVRSNGISEWTILAGVIIQGQGKQA